MASFQKIVLYTAIVILIIILVIIGIAFSYSSNQDWPPIIPECPDYWISDGSGNDSQCINVKNLGICPPKAGDKFLKMNFNTDPFTGDNGDCSKYNWSTKCKVSWDGINYGVSNPCE